MLDRRVPLCLALLLVVVLPVADGRADEELDPWYDQAVIDKYLDEACTAVEKACGATFTERPKAVLSTTEELAAVLEKEMDGILRVLGAENDEQVALLCATLAQGLAAKCEPSGRVIHVMGDNVESLTTLLGRPELMTEDVLRIVLIHEATHALDFQRFPVLEKERQGRQTEAGVQVIGAVLEGHAQYVTEQVSEVRDLQAGFQKFLTLTTLQPPIDDPLQKLLADQFLAEIEFTYIQGHRFMEAVAEAKGVAGVEAVLRSPPTAIRQIERPELWLDPSLATPFEPEVVFAAFEPLFAVGDWTKQVSPFKRTQLEAAAAMLPTAVTAPVTDAFEDARLYIGHTDAGAKQVIVAVILFATQEAASGYVRLNRTLSEAKDEAMKEGLIRIISATYEDGVGPDHSLPGLSAEKEIVAGLQEGTVRFRCLARGKLSVEVTFVDTAHTDEEIATVVKAAYEAVAPEEAATEPEPVQPGPTKSPSPVMPGG